MGVNLGGLLPATSVELEHLRGRVIAIDAYNTLYQFLSIIRQPDGTPLMSSSGEITSHLAGLLYRTSNLFSLGIKVAYVFDGVPPEKKAETLAARASVRQEARQKWDDALEAGDTERARTYAQQSSRLTKEMVGQSKQLLSAMGVPFVQAPGEGEAQASLMCARGDVWAAGSQDFDSLLFGSPRLLRNMAVTGRRKLPKKNIYVVVKPELLELEKIRAEHGLSREDLVEIALMVGTDYKPGINGVGPKKALAALKAGKSVDEMHAESGGPADLSAVRDLFLHPADTQDYSLEWGEPDTEEAKRLLVDKYEFSSARVDSSLAKMREAFVTKGSQSRLGDWE